MSAADPGPHPQPFRLWRWPRTEWAWLTAGVLTVVLLVIGVAVLLSGPGADARAVQLRTPGVQTSARITRIETTGRPSPRVSIAFPAADGQVISADDQQPGGQHSLGKAMGVVYDPADPRSFAYGTRADVDAPEPVWVFFGASIVGVGLWRLVRTLLGLRRLRSGTAEVGSR